MGKKRWGFTTPDPIDSSPTLSSPADSGGVVYIGSFGDNL
jgi:outer membrane protein assembly factor BamB